MTMRRSAAKSRGDRSRTDSVPGNAASAPIQPVESVDIVPGRLTESTWTGMLSQEEGEEVVVDIIAELMEGVMDRCYQVYLQRQLIPFSVWWAQHNLAETLECLLLRRDEGDDPEHEVFWQEDPEPQPCATDSWAEGSVPVLHSAQEQHKA
ncbi:uncharacterized protein C2orf81 homolog isoform X1 [Puntigrus tetrazona]|uniref:uncharacterized protein C2orf81 homolog isoform X1 n=1 Tax=Puntigrus tetrazona TaxID=1606681 RepID=UPI001C8AAC1F|nr:uncharacterized protein C2orf81 homolog isoform X1 [Puntigrus tetrazona]XP_043076522.1 uncharacterized protein C2orf81 homolog isoform X1 [Puntigrus tetrazona]